MEGLRNHFRLQMYIYLIGIAKRKSSQGYRSVVLFIFLGAIFNLIHFTRETMASAISAACLSLRRHFKIRLRTAFSFLISVYYFL